MRAEVSSADFLTTAASPPQMFPSDSEMSRRIRAYDWSKTPLGPIENWPQSLKTTVSICLASRFPIVLYWGREYVVLYNDSYSAILGAKHPAALGQRCRECWAEIWDTIGPMLNSVFEKGEATWSADLLLRLRRFGYLEECYFSFSFSPVQIENGEVGGIFTAVIETSEEVIGRRRLRTLRDLAARAVDVKSEPDAWQMAAATLAENSYDVPFAVLCQASEETLRVADTAGIQLTHPLCTALCQPGSELFQKALEVTNSAQTVEVDCPRAFAGDLPSGPWDTPPQKLLLIPLAALGQGPSGLLLAAVTPCKALDDSYRTFFELLARQIATSIADARAYEEERKRAEALAELDRAKTTFFSNVSHELRTPLTLVLGPTELALSSPERTLKGAELEMAHRNQLRLLKLVNTLLDFSRIEAGRIQATYEPTDLAALTADLVSEFRSAIEQSGLRLIVQCPRLPEQVYVDHEMWEKIVLNLVSNAFKSTFEGEIEVSLRTHGKQVELTVRDTGTGIAKEELPRLFERFHRIPCARRRTHEGTGIGLALVQELVRLHGGCIAVDSEVGKGTVFTVSIPLGTGHLPKERISAPRELSSTSIGAKPYVTEALGWLASPDSAEELRLELGSFAEAPGTRRASGRVLVVDDNRDMREYAGRLLSGRFEVCTAENGKVALERILSDPPDLVLTDIMMPEIDGFELLQAIRKNSAISAIPVIVISARAGEESKVEGLNGGADDYLVKPFTSQELIARVQTHIEIARRRKQAEHILREQKRLLQESNAMLEAELADIRLLQNISSELVPEHDIQTLCGKMVGAAVAITRSDFASMQVLYPERGSGGELRLLAFRGFDEQAARFWEWVNADSACACGVAFRTGKRVIVPDVESCEFMAGTEDQQAYRQAGIRACQTTPLIGRSGRIVGMISTHWKQAHQPSERDFRLLDILARQAADLIERKRSEQQLAKQAGLLDLSSDAIIMRDMEGRILYWNAGAEQVYGWTRKEALGKNLHELLQTQFPEPLERITEKLTQAGRWQGEFVQTTRDGRRITVLCRKALDRGSGGEPAAVLETTSDITDRKHVEEQLRKTEKLAAAGQLAASLAHEINNPLSSVTNALFLLKHRSDLHSDAKYLVETASSELARVSRIVKQSLSYYRAGTVPQEVDLPAIVEESLQIFGPRFLRAGIQLTRKITPGMSMSGFAHEIRQTVDNLLLNAIEATPKGGRLAVAVHPSQNWKDNRKGVRLTIADTGCGVPRQHLRRIFEPFFTTKAERGTGLGLWVVRGIVARHDGRIGIRSREKKGTVISIFWPASGQVRPPLRARLEPAA